METKSAREDVMDDLKTSSQTLPTLELEGPLLDTMKKFCEEFQVSWQEGEQEQGETRMHIRDRLNMEGCEVAGKYQQAMKEFLNCYRLMCLLAESPDTILQLAQGSQYRTSQVEEIEKILKEIGNLIGPKMDEEITENLAMYEKAFSTACEDPPTWKDQLGLLSKCVILFFLRLRPGNEVMGDRRECAEAMIKVSEDNKWWLLCPTDILTRSIDKTKGIAKHYGIYLGKFRKKFYVADLDVLIEGCSFIAVSSLDQFLDGHKIHHRSNDSGKRRQISQIYKSLYFMAGKVQKYKILSANCDHFANIVESNTFKCNQLSLRKQSKDTPPTTEEPMKQNLPKIDRHGKLL